MTTLTRKPIAAVLQPVKAKERQLTQVIAFRPRTTALQVLPQQSLAVFQPKAERRPQPMRKLPDPRMFAAQQTSGSLSRLFGEDLLEGGRIEIELPLGMKRFVTALTLKRLLKGKRSDTLLKNNGATWIICDDDLRIDLEDTQTQFRVGRVAVYS
jgi:hypothetical protein